MHGFFCDEPFNSVSIELASSVYCFFLLFSSPLKSIYKLGAYTMKNGISIDLPN